jgi:hypothetical protein
MIRFGGFRLFPRVMLVCGLLNAAESLGQTPPAAQPMEMTVPMDGTGPPTLHAYANLIQIPVLVLSAGRLTAPVIKPERFSLSIDNGPRYQPTHVRQEGVDPISLTIVLDFVGTAAELMPKISEAIDHVTPNGLTPRDHVSLMVMQCKLSDVIEDVPAEPGLLQPQISQAVKAWGARDRSKPCEEDTHLWDVLAMATLRLSDLPGRRVIIAVSDGVDRGSQHTPLELASEMQTYAVTTFGVRPAATDQSMTSLVGKTIMTVQSSMGQMTTQYPLQAISELSGGMTLQADRLNAGKQIAHVPELVRNRYILEFPRPSNATQGGHQFDVKVARSDDFVRASGVTFPLADPKIAADPTTLPNDPALTPRLGKPKPPPPPPR